ncbi:WD40-like protein [Oesophagostomum dentatum]|uniref:WD40-like protein n=1 Tax=Oesophagostomum dentatum TaxID=61180 RepID=A0A0B1S900_OESDE|nr:WD40-like protein [Oesophagostomum dentatum]
MELFVVNVDGSNLTQITNLGGASWAPYYLTDNRRIVFSSNYDDSDNGFGAFALYVINDDGTGLERGILQLKDFSRRNLRSIPCSAF